MLNPTQANDAIRAMVGKTYSLIIGASGVIQWRGIYLQKSPVMGLYYDYIEAKFSDSSLKNIITNTTIAPIIISFLFFTFLSMIFT
ncbi:hypothetical protein XBFM1_2330054 [Xenorhabdus bovienii str. feltiae Moldova]|uniref:Uncharacterized protein n=1 Tax=Xenorhabdus bovienii str. feltiae Moldova TaxID=1398200 RepID=A0A077NW44_XENBV|nr:hypothetical protein XBFM1_2330054 [Xenorhabdus bovienii str. feltiae Moldova]